MTESKIQTQIMTMLDFHQGVAWAYVTSTGTYKGLKGGRPIRIGITGMPDIIGQSINGQMIGIEVKKPGEKPSKEQFDFIEMMNKNGGLAFWTDSMMDAMEKLNDLYA